MIKNNNLFLRACLTTASATTGARHYHPKRRTGAFSLSRKVTVVTTTLVYLATATLWNNGSATTNAYGVHPSHYHHHYQHNPIGGARRDEKRFTVPAIHHFSPLLHGSNTGFMTSPIGGNPSTRLYSTLRTTTNDEDDDDDDDDDDNEPPPPSNGSQDNTKEIQKWERMYARGEVRRQEWVGGSTSDRDDTRKKTTSSSSSSSCQPIRVISFDLDNCLWKTSAVIDSANDALAEYLRGVLPPTNATAPPVVRAEAIMKELWEADRVAYAPVLGEAATGPCRLTQLRKDAVREILMRHGCCEGDPTQRERIAQRAFDVWARARHDAIPHNMAQNVVVTLNKIRQSFNNNNNDDDDDDDDENNSRIIMGAITDGNSDPTRVECLRPFFDFVVNAESVGVSKPDPRVYLQAMQHVTQTIMMTEDGNDDDDSDDDDDREYTIREDQVGSWWVHVGDDFVKDIVAAKSMGMRTVWSRELVQPKKKRDDGGNVGASTTTMKPQQQPERTVEDFMKQVSGMKVVRMEVGATDYLAESLREEFADAVIDTFAELPDVLMEWHTQGKLAATNINNDDDYTSPLEVFHPDGPLQTEEAVDSQTVIDPSSTSTTTKTAADTKFCVFCGERIPRAAKFCSSCGEKQPAL